MFETEEKIIKMLFLSKYPFGYPLTTMSTNFGSVHKV
jgi:hypothetical protein